MTAPCGRNGCLVAAASVVGIQLFPTQALMKFYKTSNPLGRLILTLPVCEAHFKELELEGVAALMPDENLTPIVELYEKQTGVAVDKAASKLVQVSFTDPDYLKMKRMKESA